MEIVALLKGENGAKIAQMIELGVRLTQEQETLKIDFKALAEEAKDELGIKTVEFNKAVKVAYDSQVLVDKQEELDQLKEIVDILDSQ